MTRPDGSTIELVPGRRAGQRSPSRRPTCWASTPSPPTGPVAAAPSPSGGAASDAPAARPSRAAVRPRRRVRRHSSSTRTRRSASRSTSSTSERVDRSRPGSAGRASRRSAPTAAPSPAPRRRPGRRPSTRPTTRDELWVPIVLIVLVGLLRRVGSSTTVTRSSGVRRWLVRRVPATARRRRPLMGISLRRSRVWLLLLVPALAADVRPPSSRRGGAWARAAVAPRSSSARSCCRALVLALAGFQLVLPVDRLATVFVVDLSDSRRQRRPRGCARVPARDAQGDARGRRGRHRRVRQGRPGRAAARRSSRDIDRIASHAGQGRHGHRRRRSDSPPRSSPTTRRSGSSCSPTATTRPAAARPRPRSRRPRRSRIETRAIGLVDVDEVLVERLTTPSTARLGENDPGRSPTSARRSPSRPRSGCSPTARWSRTAAGRARGRRHPGHVRRQAHRGRLPHASAPSSRPPATRSARTTGPTRTRSSRASRGRWSSPANDGVAAELVAALEGPAPAGRHDDPRGAPDRPREPRHLRQHRRSSTCPRLRLNDRQLAALQVYVRDLGKGLVMVGGPRTLRRGRLQEDADRGDAAGRHGRPRPPEAAGHRARRRHRPVGLDGRLPLQHVRPAAPGSGIAGVQKVDIGKEAILRAAAAMTERDELGVVAFNESAHWVVKTQPLGDGRRPAGPDRARSGRRPDQHLRGARRRRSTSLERVAATRRHIILLTDGWSSSGQYDDIIKQDEGRPGSRSRPSAPAAARTRSSSSSRSRAAAGSTPPPTPPASPTSSSRRPSRSPASRSSRSRSSRSRPRRRRSCAASTRGCRSSSATTARRPSPRPRPCWSRRATIRSSPSGSTASAGPWRGRRTRPVDGRRTGSAWSGFDKFFRQLVSWTFPGEETDGIEATFETKDGRTSLHVESVEADGSPRDFYSTHAVLVGPDLEPHDVALSQVAPGVYEAALGEIDPGAYAVRITQTRPGSSPLGRTVGLVAPTSAEYRLLGTNEAFLAALRAATGGTSHHDRPPAMDARPDGHEPLHRPVAAAAHPRAAALAARHRAAARLGGSPRARAGARVGARDRPATAGDGTADDDRASLLAARERATGAPSRASLRGSGTATAEPTSADPAATSPSPSAPPPTPRSPAAQTGPTPAPAAPPPAAAAPPTRPPRPPTPSRSSATPSVPGAAEPRSRASPDGFGDR